MRLLSIASLTLIALGLASCSGGKPAANAANILHANLGTEVQDLDPHRSTGVPEHRACTALFQGLCDLDPASMEPVPGVASSWTVSEDRLTYTFTLRPEAKWSNGDPFVADDFIYSWKRMLTPTLATEYAYMLFCLKNGKAYNEGAIKDFNEVGAQAPDPQTLVVTLESPTPWFLAMQIHQSWLPVQQKTVESFGAMDDRANTWSRGGNHVGNGAFRLVEWRPNEYIEVVKNEHYWDAANVKLDGIRLYPIDNLQTEERSFRSGDLQITEDIPLDKIPVYQKENPKVLRLDPYMGVYYYRMNVTRPPLNDKRVRQALTLALDREEICRNVMKAGEHPATQYVPPDCGHYESSAHVSYDIARAKQLLAEAGFPEGKGIPPIEILYNTSENHKRIAETIQRIWKDNLGIEVRLLNQDWKVYLTSMDNLDYMLARSGWIADYTDPMNFLECFQSESGNNRTGFKSPEYDAMLAASLKETDEAKRFTILQEAETLLLDEMPFIPIYFYTRKFLMAEEVKGYVPNVLGYIRWKDLYLAKGQ